MYELELEKVYINGKYVSLTGDNFKQYSTRYNESWVDSLRWVLAFVISLNEDTVNKFIKA
jgi:hypothetical protein